MEKAKTSTNKIYVYCIVLTIQSFRKVADKFNKKRKQIKNNFDIMSELKLIGNQLEFVKEFVLTNSELTTRSCHKRKKPTNLFFETTTNINL